MHKNLYFKALRVKNHFLLIMSVLDLTFIFVCTYGSNIRSSGKLKFPV